jgi:hypothetical protein
VGILYLFEDIFVIWHSVSKVNLYIVCDTQFLSKHTVSSHKQQHNMKRCGLHIMPAKPNARYFSNILPSIITLWRTLEISDLEADILSSPFKICSFQFYVHCQIRSNHRLLSAEMSARQVKWYFVVLT